MPVSRTRPREGYNNTAYVAVNLGFEVQIGDLGCPDPLHRMPGLNI